MTIRTMLVIALGLGVAAGTGCKKKDDKAADPGSAAPMADQGSAAAKAVEEPPKPAKLNPKTGEEVIAAYKECTGYVSEGKFDDFKSKCMNDDFKFHMVDAGDDMTVDAAIDMMKKERVAFPDMKLTPQVIIASGKNILAVSMMTGTNSGPRHTPMGEMPATNKKVGMMFFHRVALGEAGGANEEWMYMDPMTMIGQLGQLPKEVPPVRPMMDKGLDGAPLTAITADNDAEKKNLDVVAKYTAAVNAHKAADAAAFYTDDAFESDQAEATDMKGKKALQDGFTKMWKAFPDFKVDAPATTTYAAGDFVVQLGTFSGKNDGDLGPKMKKTGKTMSGGFAQIYKMKDGKIAGIWRFRNGMATAKQLGMMPPMGAAPDAAAGDAKKDDMKKDEMKKDDAKQPE
ncbi:MAG: ester cyclase [Kofleriaceae bacterium]